MFNFFRSHQISEKQFQETVLEIAESYGPFLIAVYNKRVSLELEADEIVRLFNSGPPDEILLFSLNFVYEFLAKRELLEVESSDLPNDITTETWPAIVASAVFLRLFGGNQDKSLNRVLRANEVQLDLSKNPHLEGELDSISQLGRIAGGDAAIGKLNKDAEDRFVKLVLGFLGPRD